jgi:hypothetical protein
MGIRVRTLRAKGPQISEDVYLEQSIIITQLWQETEGPTLNGLNVEVYTLHFQTDDSDASGQSIPYRGRINPIL